MRPNPYRGGANGSRPLSILTTGEARWLVKVCPECTVFIHHQDRKMISWHDSQEIFSGQVNTLARRGFQSLYSQETKMAIKQGLVLSDEDNLAILKNRLKNRVKDFFRDLRRVKAGHVPAVCNCGKKCCKCESREPGFSRIVEISDYSWNQIPDQRFEFEAERSQARDRLEELRSEVWEHLNPKDRAILDGAIRNPSGLFNSRSLYEAMTEQERKLFLPDDEAPIVDEKEHIKKAIAARTADVRRKVRRIIASDPGDDDCCAA